MLFGKRKPSYIGDGIHDECEAELTRLRENEKADEGYIDKLETRLTRLHEAQHRLLKQGENKSEEIVRLREALEATQDRLRKVEVNFIGLVAKHDRLREALEKHGPGKCMEFDRAYSPGLHIPTEDDGDARETKSRSQLKREAVQRGEPVPTDFEETT